jgi:hypothetical protein
MAGNDSPATEGKTTHYRLILFNILLILVLAFVLSGGAALAAEVTLAWDENTDTGILGYRIWYGLESHTYPTLGYDGPDTTAAITDLEPGRVYYFAAKAYNSEGESGFSDEISYQVPDTVVSYVISASAGPNGTISPSGSVSVAGGAGRTFTITPAAGYHINTVIVDGAPKGAVSSYTFSNVTANHAITASFAADAVNYTITAAAGPNGTISPSGSVSVAGGASRTFTIAPATGYQVADVQVNGQSMGPLSSYTFANVQTSQAIHAEFEALEQDPLLNAPSLLFPEDGSGEITPIPLLEISGNFDPAENYRHVATRWQIATDAGFGRIVLDTTVDTEDVIGYLYSFQITEGILGGGKPYYWRARVMGSLGADTVWSDWSESFQFTTAQPDFSDINENGVRDDLEPASSDLDGDGTNDNDQPYMRVMTSMDGRSLMGLKALAGVERFTYYGCIDPEAMPETGKPSDLPFGMINFRVETTQVGDTARFEVYLPEVPQENVQWYKSDPVNGWYKFPVARVNNVFVFEVTDGGLGDADGVANGIIVDPLGISYTTTDAGNDNSINVLPGGAGGGSGGCFIENCSDLNGFRQFIRRLRQKLGF